MVTILILIDGFLQFKRQQRNAEYHRVTILILIDGFLQYGLTGVFNDCYTCHNPYFNRWFSAINWLSICNQMFYLVTILILIDGFLQFQNHTINM